MSWQQYQAIAREAAQLRAQDRARPPTSCPNDGEPLIAGPNGVLHCTYDGFQWPRDRDLT